MTEGPKDAGYFDIKEKTWTDTIEGKKDIASIQNLLTTALSAYDQNSIKEILGEITPTIQAEVDSLAKKINSDIAKKISMPGAHDEEITRLAKESTEHINKVVQEYATKTNPTITELATNIQAVDTTSKGDTPTEIAKKAVEAAGGWIGEAAIDLKNGKNKIDQALRDAGA